MSDDVAPADLIVAATAWADADPDPVTESALRAAIDRARTSGDAVELNDLIGERLDFGTAGLRGQMGPGSNRLNLLMARQTAAGLARTLRAHVPDAPDHGVLVGHDARHGSAAFARGCIEVLEAAGIPCRLVEGPQPTPVIAWGVRHLGTAAGIVVTASHNPAKDNGIKIYWGDGAQIVPPVDGWIAADIDASVAERLDPVGPHTEPTAAPASLVDDYVAMVVGLVGGADAGRSDLPLVSTAMHGVGAGLLRRALADAGFTDHRTVPQQEAPDPDFPTVPFPNPEEAGATDLLLALAVEAGAAVALANDPDADRLAAGIPTPDGSWRMLTGDELGALFAVGLMERRATRARSAEAGSRRPLLVTTVVSSQLLAAIAADHDARFEETLTGFKWLCRPGFEHPELEQVLAYEESIGYAVGGLCDKDGISAAVVLCDLVRGWRAEGRTPQDVLDDVAHRHGAHVTDNFSLRITGPGWAARLAAATESVVADPPATLAGITVARMDRPAADVIRMFLANGDRVVIRPSGTEPKLKVYCEAVEPVDPDEAPEAARARGRARTAAFRAELETRLTRSP